MRVRTGASLASRARGAPPGVDGGNGPEGRSSRVRLPHAQRPAPAARPATGPLAASCAEPATVRAREVGPLGDQRKTTSEGGFPRAWHRIPCASTPTVAARRTSAPPPAAGTGPPCDLLVSWPRSP